MQRMSGRPVLPYDQWPIRHEAPPPFAALEAEDGPAIVTASPAEIFAQLAFHRRPA